MNQNAARASCGVSVRRVTELEYSSGFSLRPRNGTGENETIRYRPDKQINIESAATG